MIVDQEKDGVTSQVNKRVIVHKILEEKGENSRAKVVLIVWKGGLKIDDKKKEF